MESVKNVMYNVINVSKLPQIALNVQIFQLEKLSPDVYANLNIFKMEIILSAHNVTINVINV